MSGIMFKDFLALGDVKDGSWFTELALNGIFVSGRPYLTFILTEEAGFPYSAHMRELGGQGHCD